MLVEEIMTRDVITVGPDIPVEEAIRLARERRIRHLPVVEGRNLVGIVSDRDLRGAVPPDDRRTGEPPLVVRDVMHADVYTAHPLDPLDEAARQMYEHRIGCLPVVSGGQLVGIVSETDVLRTIVEMMGVLVPGSYIEVEVPDRPGMLADVAGVVKRQGLNIASVLTLPGHSPGQKRLAIRVETIDPRRLIADLEAAGYLVTRPGPRGK